MSTSAEPIGTLIDARGVRAHLNEGDLISDVVVLMRGADENGKTFVRMAWSDGMDWIARRGIIEVARDQEVTFPDDEGDE